MDEFDLLQNTQRQRVSDGATVPMLTGCDSARRLLVIIWTQLGDFDTMEYAWWLQRERDLIQSKGIVVRAVGIGDRSSGQRFCQHTQFNPSHLFVDPTAKIHQELNLYSGLSLKFPALSSSQNAWVNMMLMCAGIGSPGTLAEVFRGYKGDRASPQLFAEDETVKAPPLPPLKGSFFNMAGGKGFQRPFELATLRLRNMSESLGNWNTYVPDASYLTQRGATFLFDSQGKLLYAHRDRGILGFAENMSQPLSFLSQF